MILDDWHWDVTTASDGLEALEILEREDIPLVLIDWIMPRMNGLEVCRRIRSGKKLFYTYIILLTAKDSTEDFLEAHEAGADDFLNKPYDLEVLNSRLQVGQRIIELENRLSAKVDQLENALAEVTQLKGLLPICMYCKKIRDDQDYWHNIENYVHDHAGTDFSHSICPVCMKQIVEPQLKKAREKGSQV